MNDLRWIEPAPPAESLACALHSLLAQRGTSASYDVIVAALGLGTLTVFDPEAPDEPGEPARDSQLAAVAGVLGVQLRELHPISAAQRLEFSDEFRLHFIDSYVPLILRAFQVGQTALAWNGWPAPNRGRWGVLLPGSNDSIRGITSGLSVAGSYTGPAYQVYIVENVAPAPLLAADAILQFALGAFEAQYRGRWSADAARLTGRAALEAIRDRLKTADSPALRAQLVALGARRRALRDWLATALRRGELTGSAAAATHWRDALGECVERFDAAALPGIGVGDLAALVDEVIQSDESLLAAAAPGAPAPGGAATGSLTSGAAAPGGPSRRAVPVCRTRSAPG